MCYTYDKSKVGIPESFKVGWYPLRKTGSSHLNTPKYKNLFSQARSNSLIDGYYDKQSNQGV